MPMLTVAFAGPMLVSTSIASNVVRTRSATPIASASVVSGKTKQNSSPPMRNSWSDGRMEVSATLENASSMRSPASCPN